MTRRQHANKFRWRVRLLGFGGWCTRSTCGMGKLCYRVWCWCGAGRDSGNCGERIRQIVSAGASDHCSEEPGVRLLPTAPASASLREHVWLACFHCAPAPAAPPRLPTLLRSRALPTLKLFRRPSKFGSERTV